MATLVHLPADAAPLTVERVGPDRFGVPVVLALRSHPDPVPFTRQEIDDLTEGAERALVDRLPFVAFLDGFGAGLTDGIEPMVAWGRLCTAMTRCSGIVPTVAVLTGEVVGPMALVVGLFDLVVSTPGSVAAVSVPSAVAQITGVEMSADELGGPGPLGSKSAVAAVHAHDLDDAEAVVASLLAFLPPHADELPPTLSSLDDPARLVPEVADVLPASPQGAYDVRDVIAGIADWDDPDDFVELWALWARNMVVGFCRMAGRSVGIVANQPSQLGGTVDIPASHKAARFVHLCDAFNIPLLTLVDTPGFYPGKDLEWRGMIRHGAQMAFCYIDATVPRVNVTLRKSYGGAYIVMDSKTIGNDITFAWPTAEIAVMGAKGAVEILHRRETPERRAELEADYERRLLNPWPAAERGFIDAVIEPAQTRALVIEALNVLSTKREAIPPGRTHHNMPL